MAFFYCTCTINTVSSSHASPTEPSEVGGKACDAPPVAEEASRVWRSGRFFAPLSGAEKSGTASGSVTVNHDAVGSRGQGGANHA